MNGHMRTVMASAALSLVAVAPPAWGFDPAGTFKKGAYVLSLEGGYGEQFNLEGFTTQSDLKFFNLGFRSSLLPFENFGAGGPLHGALELMAKGNALKVLIET